MVFEDAGNRLNGGNSDNGGLSNCNWNNSWNRWNNGAVRPLVVSRKPHPLAVLAQNILAIQN